MRDKIRFWEGPGEGSGEGFSEKFLEGACSGFTLKKGSEKGVLEGRSRRCLKHFLGEYDPLGVHPK